MWNDSRIMKYQGAWHRYVSGIWGSLNVRRFSIIRQKLLSSLEAHSTQNSAPFFPSHNVDTFVMLLVHATI